MDRWSTDGHAELLVFLSAGENTMTLRTPGAGPKINFFNIVLELPPSLYYQSFFKINILVLKYY